MHFKTVFLILLVAGTASGIASSQAGLVVSTKQDAKYTATSLAVKRGDLSNSDGSSIVFQGATYFDGPKDINAADLISGTSTFLLTTEGGGIIGVLPANQKTFSSGDIVQYDVASDTADILFEGAVHFGLVGPRVDAVHRLGNGNLLISTDVAVTVNGQAFEDEDLFEFNLTDNTASMYLDGSTVFDDPAVADLNAAHVTAQGTLLFSTDATMSIASVAYGKDDVVEWNGATATLVWNSEPDFQGGGVKDINALYSTPEPSGLALILVGGLLTGFRRRRRRRESIS